MNKAAVPRYKVIKQYIRDNIEGGSWPVSSRVPSENQLCEQFSVSRMTARKAVDELTQEGLLVRSQGLGTFVAELQPQSPLLEVRNIADEIHERGHNHSSEVLSLEEIPASETVAISLELPETSPVFHSIIIHYDNGRPLQREERYVNPRFAPDYLKQDFRVQTPSAYLSRVAALTAATHVVEAVLPTQDIADSLVMESHAPCLRIIRRSWCDKGVVSLAKLIHPGDRYRLGGHLSFT
ncbi:histidine utilization repressor [Sansalvadorimonas verongulae]|uniref:histidine utilization repressor n=1 Tax=Sansalvadorimonas verongulae TaxID=2172824 RepID=UPI0012BC1CD6|nr:histidine utilization repressor [Sansalvadorimonas verongulae]MTI13658.1 histidine utilization repressor [Sansalvadorimonas verongulae]